MTSKQKNIALLVGFVLFLVFSYQFAIKKTIGAKKELQQLQKEKEEFNNSKNQVNYLQSQNIHLDSILKSNEIGIDVSFQQVILNKVSTYVNAHDLKIISFSAPHVFQENNERSITYVLEVGGDFKKLLNFVNYFENQRLGNIFSVKFEKKKNYSSNKNTLTTTIFLQKNTN